MKIYFGQVAESYSTSGCFNFNDTYFYYELESSEDGITLKDSCGRYLPFSLDEVPELIQALTMYYNKEGEQMAEAQELMENSNNIVITLEH